MATHSNVLAWRIPGLREPGGLLSMGLHRVGHDRSNSAAAAEGWNVGGVGGMFKTKEIHIYLWLIHDVQQKPTLHYEATILQLKINFKKYIKCAKWVELSSF